MENYLQLLIPGLEKWMDESLIDKPELLTLNSTQLNTNKRTKRKKDSKNSNLDFEPKTFS